MGLIHAVDRYEPSRGVPLGAYAARTIEGEIMHLFRDHGWAVRVPRSLQELVRRVSATRLRLGHELGRTPTLEELGDAIGESTDTVAEAVAAQRAYTAQSLNEPARVDDTTTDERLDVEPALVCEERGFDAVADNDVVWRAVHTLPPREREIVALRIFHGLTQSQIADRTGISQMHVSRLLRRSFDALRDQVKPEQAA